MAFRSSIRPLPFPGAMSRKNGRGPGLAIGIEVVVDPVAKVPDPATASAIKEGLRERGVLVGTCGAAGNVIKVRPPLAFTAAEVPIFAAALDETLAALRR